MSARYVSATLVLEGQVTDVSAEGMFFSSDYLDDEGEVARIWVDVPGRPMPLELRGEVRWVNDATLGGGMGIRLIDPPPEVRRLLERLGGGEPTTEAADDVLSSGLTAGNA